ncbi:MBL fold metallo-hydrolase [Pseudomonas sp. ZM23]|uniref:MBL fold metallo-hydrolase n=1 Tax=Pseudomonas triclosanedens TaxID=2961893 RepID=A0ABY7A1F8_9PSED|nr:alkyl sulfatase dimerization domain-containing protein [Pseudomonas triclosanedens]MCP8464526.1 MBL fold metallo-hydrolase [Pseudomonas triclosanedens]MCP8473559.1 MBL fold metallo-hydrolase [Pseudomonas triclosanedens]MCP8478310.1 MBL fold metallo-hydrolase [Pseudomonas triclosanedens]WAI50991.1 MBL fold metallo-hydrolase [Pseudomonas triclosanedens]
MSRLSAAILLASLCPGLLFAAEQPKPPTSFTIDAQQKVREALPFSDRSDFDRVEKGLIKRPDNLLIKNEDGSVAWQLGVYDFLNAGKDIDSVNPSLQRQALLNLKYGLYKVTDGIYQVRGFDLANITFVQGKSGWIVIDTLTTPATAKAAYALVSQELGQKPIRAVIYSHAHVDHFGGVKGLVSQEQVDKGEVQIYAPKGFMEAAIKENVLAGNAMIRRATYQYGMMLPKGPQGQVDMAIGKGAARGPMSILAPTNLIEGDLQELEIDGVPVTFQNTPGTESPAEMNVWLPQQKALLMAENVTATLHNLYTLRGAETRDALGWSKYINEALHRFGDKAEVLFAVHNWPRWGHDDIVRTLEKQRDMYGYLNDQTLYLANQGVTINQIHERFKVPPELANEWYNRGYHGSVSHNVRAVVNKYLGYYDGNPATLNPLAPEDSAKKYVEFMGGADHLLQLAKQSYDKGEYRWVVEVVNKLIFAEPTNQAARALQADALEQLGYQAENAGWRNSYLVAAQELRNGVPRDVPSLRVTSADALAAMDTGLLFDYLGVRLNAEKAEGEDLSINLVLPDRNEQYLLELKNSHLNNIKGVQKENAGQTVTIDRADLNRLLLKEVSPVRLVLEGKLKSSGNPLLLAKLFGMLDDFQFWFDIATPAQKS